MGSNAEGAGWCHCEGTLDYLWKIVAIVGGSWGLEESNCYCYLQEGQEGGSKELEAGQTNLDAWEDDWSYNPGSHIQIY